MELFNVGSTEGVELHVFDENGVERSDDVLKKGFRRVENLHGVTYKGRKGLGWEVFEMNGRRDLYAQTFFGKARNIDPVSREELFFIFSLFQSRPINFAAFLLTSLYRVANKVIENIYVDGTVTHIAIASGLCNQIALLTPCCGHDLIDIDHCMISRLVRREGPNEYNIVILSEDESPIPLAPEYHHTASSDTSSFSLDGSPPLGERHTELQTIQTYLTTLRTDLTTLQRDFMDYTNVMAEQMDHFSSLLPPVFTLKNLRTMFCLSLSFPAGCELHEGLGPASLKGSKKFIFVGLNVLVFKEVLDGYVKSFESYKTSVESFLCTLVPETSSLHIEYTPGGLIYRPGGSNLQHATSITFLGLVYANYLSHTSHTINYGNVQVSAQSLRKRDNIKVDNILGDNLLGLSYMVGYSNNYPQRIHQHISSLPSVNDHSQNIERHCHTMTTMKGQFTSTQQILNVHVGAIVGGLEEDDVYVDDRAPFVGV
ncbi:hypothetical protein KIW84_058388 [Lathyrus oleraceus]|uniref:cellulase n=1 Tax=Pisum sativum TaxID=3888 RepID=A0A9D4X5R8_PEA|nr:hypothetical protein KIW84_058388 [Pisum sativum]